MEEGQSPSVVLPPSKAKLSTGLKIALAALSLATVGLVITIIYLVISALNAKTEVATSSTSNNSTVATSETTQNVSRAGSTDSDMIELDELWQRLDAARAGTKADRTALEPIVKEKIKYAESTYGVNSAYYIDTNIILAQLLTADNRGKEAVALLTNLASKANDTAKFYYYVELYEYYDAQGNTTKELEYLNAILNLPDNLELYSVDWPSTREYYQQKLDNYSTEKWHSEEKEEDA